MFIVQKKKNEIFSLPAQKIGPRDADIFSTKLAVRIAKKLIKEHYPAEIAKELGVHEQKVYYHIKKFNHAGILQLTKKEKRNGAFSKHYRLKKPAFFFSFQGLEPTQKITLKSSSSFISHFLKNGQLDAKIIVGSPDPHGPDKARSRDGYYGIDLGLFLGTFLNYVPDFNVKLDTEIRDKELDNNLILIGGPIVNKVTSRINDQLKIKFNKDRGWSIKSNVSGKVYPSDETGVVILEENPFNKKKKILLVAGKRYSGTRAAIISFLKDFKELKRGNIYDRDVMARVVEGVDLDSDGIIDSIEFRE